MQKHGCAEVAQRSAALYYTCAQQHESQLASRPAVSVVMPCLNEECTVGQCVGKARRALAAMGVTAEVVVCDNGSRDRSIAEATAAGARVVACGARGYGNAVRCGVEASRGELIIMGDADASYDFGCIEPFVRALREGADLVLGNRFLGGIRRGAMPWKNRYLGNPALTKILNLFFHTGVGDVYCGLRAFSRQAFDRMELECPGMEFAIEMVVKAAKRGMRIVEVPTTLDPDGRGRQPHLQPWHDGWRSLKFLLMFSPLHLFLIPGAFLVALGLFLLLVAATGIYRVVNLYVGVHWMVLAVLFLVVGSQVLQFGILARLYTVTHRFVERDPPLEWLRDHFRVEYGLLFGALLFLIGFVVDAWVLAAWIEVRLGMLEKVEPALIATGLMAIGMQIVFFSFLFAILDERGNPKR